MDFFLDLQKKSPKVDMVTTKSYQRYYWTPKMAQGKKAWDKGRSPPHEIEVGPRSGPYLLICIN